MTKKKSVTDVVANSISRLASPYIEKYDKKILGIYLCPYQIGGIQRIDVVVLHNNNEEIPVIKKQVLINELRIQVSTKSITNYQGSIDCNRKKEAARDLKSSVVVYDPRNILVKKLESLQNNDEVPKFYNSFELPNEVIKRTKSKVYSIKKGSN